MNANESLRASSGRVYGLIFSYLVLSVFEVFFNHYIVGVAPLPMLLSTAHALVFVVVSVVLYYQKSFTVSKLTTADQLKTALFGALYTGNVVVSLYATRTAMHEMSLLKPLTPLLVIAIELLIMKLPKNEYVYKVYVFLAVIVVAAWWSLGSKDKQATSFGFIVALVASILTALRAIFTNQFQVSSSGRKALFSSPLEMIMRMAPYILLFDLLAAFYTGEVSKLRSDMAEGKLAIDWLQFSLLLLINGLVAYVALAVTLQTNKTIGTVCMATCNCAVKPIALLTGAVWISFMSSSAPRVSVTLTGLITSIIILASAGSMSRTIIKNREASTFSKD